MFRIPKYAQMEMTFEEAEKIIKRLTGNNTLLDGLEYMNNLWEKHTECGFADNGDEDFYEEWTYEVNAFNVVFNKMQPLFASKGAK